MDDQCNEHFVRVLGLRMREGLDTPANLMKALYLAAAAGNIVIFHDRFERPAGYVAWAGLAKETVRQTLKSGELRLRAEDLNEGHFIYVVDVMIRRSSALTLKHAFAHLPVKSRLLLYSRANELRAVRIVDHKFVLYGKAKVRHAEFCT